MLERYKNLLLKLLPSGRAWNKAPDSFLSRLMEGVAVEFSRLEARGYDLAREVDPRVTTELLEEWERVLGLPDECDFENMDSSTERRSKLVNRALATRGGQSPQFFIDYIAALGFDATVTEFREFKAGRARAGDALTNGIDWINSWQLNLPATIIYEFTAGSRAGEPLRVFRNDSVECSINHLKPAHSQALFAFEGA